MMREVNKQYNCIEYILIIALYYVTGGAFSYTAYSAQITIFFLLSGIICILSNSINRVFIKKTFTTIFFMSFFLILVPILNKDGFSSYIAIILQLFIGLFCSIIIPLDEFKRKYVNIIVFFSFISLIGFSLGMLYPSIATYFPVTIGDASVDYYNAGVYVFMQPKGFGAFRLTARNAGICWEPGCYQMFLNIALFFLLDHQEKENDDKFILKLGILIITILTTGSTTGILLLAINLIVFRNYLPLNFINDARKLFVIIMLLVLAVFMLSRLNFTETVLSKIHSEFFVSDLSNQKWYDRISISKIGYLFYDGFWFFGMSFPRWVYIGTSLWNSIIHSFLCLGIPFTLIHLTLYWRGTKVLSKHHFLLFFIMVVCASTETLFWRVFFNTIAFYGLTIQKEKTKELL